MNIRPIGQSAGESGQGTFSRPIDVRPDLV
jgi:hypothetical protein